MKELRIAAGLSQEALAREVGVSLQTVGTWERRVNTPSLERAIKLAEVLRSSLKTMAAAVGLDVSRIPDDYPSEPRLDNYLSEPELAASTKNLEEGMG